MFQQSHGSCLSRGIHWYFFVLFFFISTSYAQDTVIIKTIPGSMIPEVIIQQAESQETTKKPPPKITSQKFSEKNLSRLAKSLIFVEGGERRCAINEMDARTGARKIIYQPKRCFLKLIVRNSKKFILIYDGVLQEISLSPVLKEGSIIKHPNPIKRKDTSLSEYYYAGYDKKGNLSIVMRSFYLWDDEYSFLYKHRNGKWELVNEKKCNRFEWCGYEELYPERKSSFFWGEELNPWHEKQGKNPYVTQRKVTAVGNEYNGDRIYELTFNFSGRKSVLIINTSQGGDTGSTLTMRMTLKVQDKAEIEITNRQSSASLMGKYLINYGFWGDGHKLYDIGTGEVLSVLFTSSWVYE